MFLNDLSFLENNSIHIAIHIGESVQISLISSYIENSFS